MGDRRSDSSYEATIEEALVGVKADSKTINQLSSSGRAAQAARTRGVGALSRAVQDVDNKAAGGKDNSTQQSSGEGGKK